MDEDIDNIETWLFEMIRELDIAEDSEFLKKLLYWSSSYNVSETGQYKVNVMDKQLVMIRGNFTYLFKRVRYHV